MLPGKIWRKTLIFSWIQLGLGLVTFFVCLIIGVLAWLLIKNFEFSIYTNIAIGCVAFLIAISIYFVMMARTGYNIKMGHLAIIERANRGEPIPNNPVEFSKDVVKQRFGNNRKFYLINRNISTSRNQILRIIAKGFSLDTDVPNKNGSSWIRLLICAPALDKIDECCLTYALRRTDYEVNAACIDALTILVQDWRPFIKRATVLSIFVYVLCFTLLALFFLPGFYLLKSLAIQPLFWLAISFFLVLTVKVAFIDSYTMTKIVCQFLDITKDAQIKPENYKKLDDWSDLYKKLRKAAEQAAEQADDEKFKSEQAALMAERKAAKALPSDNVENTDLAEDAKVSNETEPETTNASELQTESSETESSKDEQESLPTDSQTSDSAETEST